MWRNIVIAFVIFEIVVSGILAIHRGATGGVKQYDANDVLANAIEGPLLIWAVIWLANS